MNLNGWLRAQTPRFGMLLTIDNAATIEVARLACFDWLWIDGEHGQFNEVSAAVACALCAGGPATFVRLPDFSPTAIKRYLETGCDAIILPAVSTSDDVQAIALAALYPPRGQRSVGIGFAAKGMVSNRLSRKSGPLTGLQGDLRERLLRFALV